ncbi:MAG: hypothetical protein ACP5M4_10045 [Acidobacteriaceae bacterium]
MGSQKFPENSGGGGCARVVVVDFVWVDRGVLRPGFAATDFRGGFMG